MGGKKSVCLRYLSEEAESGGGGGWWGSASNTTFRKVKVVCHYLEDSSSGRVRGWGCLSQVEMRHSRQGSSNDEIRFPEARPFPLPSTQAEPLT